MVNIQGATVRLVNVSALLRGPRCVQLLLGGSLFTTEVIRKMSAQVDDTAPCERKDQERVAGQEAGKKRIDSGEEVTRKFKTLKRGGNRTHERKGTTQVITWRMSPPGFRCRRSFARLKKRTHKCTKQSMKKGGYMKREEESVDLIAEAREQVQQDR